MVHVKTFVKDGTKTNTQNKRCETIERLASSTGRVLVINTVHIRITLYTQRCPSSTSRVARNNCEIQSGSFLRVTLKAYQIASKHSTGKEKE